MSDEFIKLLSQSRRVRSEVTVIAMSEPRYKGLATARNTPSVNGPPKASIALEPDQSITTPLLRNHPRSSTDEETSFHQDGIDDEIGKRTLAKIDRAIIPLLFITYMFNFMDKVILSSAAVFGLREDTVSLSVQFWCIFTDSISASQRPTVQLGRKCLLPRLSPLDLPNHPSCCTAADRKIHHSKHDILGLGRCVYCRMSELWRSLDHAILARYRGSDNNTRFHVSHLYMVHS